MRRPTAISMLLFWLAICILPVVSAASDTVAPFCCRAKGIHHCTMSGESPSEQLVLREPGHCPYSCPGTTVAQPSAHPGWLSSTSQAPVHAERTISIFNATLSHHPAFDDADKRGPPTLAR